MGFFNKKYYDLIIWDDIYPHPSSGFRLEEFTYLLKHIPNSKALLSGSAYNHFKLPSSLHQQHISNLIQENKELAGKLQKTNETNHNIKCGLFYCVFLNNIFQNLGWLEINRIPFAFTLYPGGGFIMGDVEAEGKLEKIFSSPFFKKVIVTQKHTFKYLLEKKFCKEEDITFVFGGVTPQISLQHDNKLKRFYGESKSTIDICFCASRYTQYGEDKGYPLFVEMMKALYVEYSFVYFHVIGGFDKGVLDISSIQDRITFYGYLDFDKLKHIFQNMDIIVSPNQPNKLAKGAFDGFPLGTVIEAAFNEVLVMATDCLNENEYFEDGKEIIIIQPQLEDILQKINWLINDTQKIYEVALNGKKKFTQIYSNNFQMVPRQKLLMSLVNNYTKSEVS